MYSWEAALGEAIKETLYRRMNQNMLLKKSLLLILILSSLRNFLLTIGSEWRLSWLHSNNIFKWFKGFAYKNLDVMPYIFMGNKEIWYGF